MCFTSHISVAMAFQKLWNTIASINIPQLHSTNRMFCLDKGRESNKAQNNLSFHSLKMTLYSFIAIFYPLRSVLSFLICLVVKVQFNLLILPHIARY